MGDFNAKVVNKQAGDYAVWDYDVGTMYNKRELLAEFEEQTNLRIMNI